MPLCFTCFQQHLEVHWRGLTETTYYSRFAHARRSLHSYASTVPVQQCSTNDLPSRLLIFSIHLSVNFCLFWMRLVQEPIEFLRVLSAWSLPILPDWSPISHCAWLSCVHAS